MADVRPAMASALAAFGVPATVTRPAPDNTPIVTIGFWAAPSTQDVLIGAEMQRRDVIRIFVLPTIDLLVNDVAVPGVPRVPNNTLIVAQEFAGAEPQTWRVDQVSFADVDHRRLVVVPNGA